MKESISHNLSNSAYTTNKNKMKIAAALIFAPLVQGFSVVSNSARMTTSLCAGVGIYCSSSTGNTETVSQYIADAIGGVEYQDIGDTSDDEILGNDALIVGAPTWHTDADEQRSGTSWDDWLYDTLPNIDVKGKNVAVFGCGDQQSYS